MGFPKRISDLPNAGNLKNTDIFVLVNENDVTSQTTLEEIVATMSANTNTFVTGGTLTGTNLILEKNDGTATAPIDLSALSGSGSFTGNTSGTCISELWVSSISGCSPVHIGTGLIVDEGLTVNGDFEVENLNITDTLDVNDIEVEGGASVNGGLNVLSGLTTDTLEIENTLTLNTIPTLNNGEKAILVRNNNTGEVEYRNVLSIITAATSQDIYVTSTKLVGNLLSLKRSNAVEIFQDLSPLISGKLDLSLFSAYTADTQTEINSKVDTSTFTSYSALTEMLIETKLDTTTFNTYTANTTDNTFVTGATLIGNVLELERNNGLSGITVNLSSLTGDTSNVYNSDGIVGAGRTLTITDSITFESVSGPTYGGWKFTPAIAGGGANDYATINYGNRQFLKHYRANDGWSFGTPDTTNSFHFNTGTQTMSDGWAMKVHANTVSPYGALILKGYDNTSGSTAFQVTDSDDSNLLSVRDDGVIKGKTIELSGGHLTVTSLSSETSNTAFLVQDSEGNHIIEALDTGRVHIGDDTVNSPLPTNPTLIIGAGKTPNDRGSLAFTSTGIGIGGDNDGTNDFLLFRLNTNQDSQWRFYNGSSFGWILNDRQNNAFGSQSGLRTTISTARSYGMDFMLNINGGAAVTDTCGFRFSSKDSTIGGANDVERFVIENGAPETKSYFDNISVLGLGTSNPNTNVKLHVSGDTLVSGSFTASTMTLNNVPAFDDDGAAATGGLTVGDVYQTTGGGAAPLNVAGILMIKQ